MTHHNQRSAISGTSATQRPSALTECAQPCAVLRVASLSLLVLLCVSGSRLHAAGASASAYFKHGQAAEARQDYDTAFEDYQKAFQKNPKDLRFQTALYRVRVSAASAHISAGHKLMQSGDLQDALAEFL